MSYCVIISYDIKRDGNIIHRVKVTDFLWQKLKFLSLYRFANITVIWLDISFIDYDFCIISQFFIYNNHIF